MDAQTTIARQFIFTKLSLDPVAWKGVPLSDILQQLREKAGYSIEDMAQKLGCPVDYAQRMERSTNLHFIKEFIRVIKPHLQRLERPAILERIRQIECSDSEKRYGRKEQQTIGNALGAMMEFLDVPCRMLVPDIFCEAQDTSKFLNGKRPLAKEKINRIPEKVMQAYRENKGNEPPEYASSTNVWELTEKGLRLANLNKEYLRAAITPLLQEQEKTQVFLSNSVGISSQRINEFLNNRGNGKNLGTYCIAKMGAALGVPDIFELEKMGKAVLEHAHGPHGHGLDKNGKPLPDAEGDPRAGTYLVLEALRRAQAKGAFRG